MATRWDEMTREELEVLFGLRRPFRPRTPGPAKARAGQARLADPVEEEEALALGGEAGFNPIGL